MNPIALFAEHLVIRKAQITELNSAVLDARSPILSSGFAAL